MNFKYQELAGRLMPIIPIEIRGKEWISFNAYVDSGAGYSIFHARTAEMLGLDLESGKKIYITVGDGSQIIVYIHKIMVKLVNAEFEANVGFSRNLGIGFNIIGREDIFNRFKICFDDKDGVVEFHAR